MVLNNTLGLVLQILTRISFFIDQFSLLKAANQTHHLKGRMVFTDVETTAFFEDANQMAIPAGTRPGLNMDGVVSVDDLEDFTEDDLNQVAQNLRKPAGLMVDPNNRNRRIPQTPYVFGAKSLKRLKVAAIAASYYKIISRELTPANMHYENCLVDFYEQWENLLKKGDTTEPDTPRITRTLPIIKWTESFEEFLHQVLGVQSVPLSYVIREQSAVNPAPPPLANNRSYSDLHESVAGELIVRTSHLTSHYTSDNQKVFKYIEEATRETRYSSSIAPFSRAKDGRGAWKALMSQYVGRDKWQKELEKQENFLHTRVWKGNSTFSLESFIMQHRTAHISMQRCAEHVPYQVPNERTRVMHLLNGIKSSDAELLSAIAVIKSDDEPGGRIERFEDTAAFLIQFDPVTKKRQKSGTIGRQHQVAGVELKKGIGKTGVALRYHSKEEYRKLTDEQKMELKEWRIGQKNNKKRNETQNDGANEPTSNKSKGKRQRRFEKQLIAALREFGKKDETDENKEDESLIKQLVSVVTENQKSKSPHKPSGESQAKKSGPNKLQSILERIRSNHE